jgi:hypothetical protein
MNYRVIQNFQFTTADKKIDVLKIGSILAPDLSSEEQYVFKKGTKEFLYDAQLIENNPEFFEAIDWRDDLLVEMKKCKMKTVAPMFKTVVNFLNNEILSKNTLIQNDYLSTLASACYQSYKKTGEVKFLEPLTVMGYEYNENDYWKKFTKKSD